MNRNIAWLLLSLSVLFNLFFLAGYLKARNQPAPTPAVNPVAVDLDLDEQQAAVLSECKTSFGEDAEVFNEALAFTREAFRRELEQHEPDQTRLAELIDEEMEFIKQWRQAHVERLVQFVRALEPEQREMLSRRMARSPRHEARMQRMLQRFDRNGDGKIDEAEAAEAAKLFDDKGREMRGRRQHMMMRRFDADGDGELNEQERAEMEAHRRRIARQFDADGDGELSPEEQDELRRSMRQRGWGGGPNGGEGPGGGRRNRGPLPFRP